MTNLMQDGITWLADRLTESAGQTVVYRRGAQSVTLTDAAWLGNPRTQEVGADGIILERHDLLDATFKSASLVLDGVAELPRRGDRVEIARGTVTDTYEVMSFGDEPPHWWPDTDHAMVGVHLRQIGKLYG